MTSTLRKVALLVGKDLRIEARSRQTLGLVIMLGVLIIVVLGMGLGRKDAPAFGAAAVLWVAYLFGGTLCFEKTMAVERQDGALTGLLAAPIDRGIVFAGKLVTNLLLMFTLAIVVTPVAILLFGFDLSAAPGGFAGVRRHVLVDGGQKTHQREAAAREGKRSELLERGWRLGGRRWAYLGRVGMRRPEPGRVGRQVGGGAGRSTRLFVGHLRTPRRLRVTGKGNVSGRWWTAR